ncbi:DUF6178 family protein [Sorangium sp. So ce1151]|uniref:DUF6178 family protein n=1 Tax=Sorangium sp. So ce1151 TaxID=3133332 RepID=UPI003F5F7DB2
MTTTLARSTHPRHLVARLLEQPGLVHLVQGLEAPVLTRLIRHIGLEDAGEIVALATTEQLKGIFDEDLWRSERPGKDETFDADRFALWLEVMLEAGEAFAAQKIAELDEDFVTMALYKHVLVIDVDRLGVQMTSWERLSSLQRGDDPDLIERALDNCAYHEFEEFRVIAMNQQSWDAILLVLVELDKEHHALLRALLERCCAMSTVYIEQYGGLYDVLTSEEMVESDAAAEREDRREQGGFVAPSAAVSFLNLARVTPLEELLQARTYDAVTRAHFRAVPAEPRAAAAATRRLATPDGKTAASAESVRSFLEVLREADILPPAAEPALLTAGAKHEDELLFTSAIREVMARDAELYAKRLMELSYLVNVLISGCSHEGRAFRPFEAVEAAICTCNLGFERLLGERAGRKKPSLDELASVLTEHDAVKMFMAGWSLLHHEVQLFAADALRRTLATLAASQSDAEVAREVERVAVGLGADLDAGKPWRARGKLGRIKQALGGEARSVFRALLDELPTLPRGVGRGARPRGGRRLRFISTAAQIQAIQAWLEQPAVVGAKGPERSAPADARAKPRRKRPQPGSSRKK